MTRVAPPPILRVEEARALLVAAHRHELEIAVRLGAVLGVTVKELRGLSWPDLDGGLAVLRGSRNPAGRRSVPVPPGVARLIKEHRASGAERPVDEGLCGRLVVSFLDWSAQAGIRPVEFDELARAFPVQLLKSGAPVLVVMELLGRRAVSPLARVHGTPVSVATRRAVCRWEAHLYGEL